VTGIQEIEPRTIRLPYAGTATGTEQAAHGGAISAVGAPDTVVLFHICMAHATNLSMIGALDRVGEGRDWCNGRQSTKYPDASPSMPQCISHGPPGPGIQHPKYNKSNVMPVSSVSARISDVVHATREQIAA
jgi:hypothetical protein